MSVLRLAVSVVKRNQEGILHETNKTPSIFLIVMGKYFVASIKTPSVFYLEGILAEGKLSEKIFWQRRYFGGEEILSEKIFWRKVFCPRRYFGGRYFV